MNRENPVLGDEDMGRLGAVVDSLGAASDELEALSSKVTGNVSREDAWVLEGFHDEAMIVLREVVVSLARIHSTGTGSINEKDAQLAAVFGEDLYRG